MVKASNALKSACDIVFAGLSAGGPFQGTAIKTPAGRPCGLVGVSEFLETVKEFLAGECNGRRPLGDHRWSPWTQSDGNRADRLEKKEGDGGRGEETGG